MHHIDTPQSFCDGVAVANVALDEINFCGSSGVFPDVQDFHLLTARMKTAGNEIAKKTRTTCDQVSHAMDGLLRAKSGSLVSRIDLWIIRKEYPLIDTKPGNGACPLQARQRVDSLTPVLLWRSSRQ